MKGGVKMEIELDDKDRKDKNNNAKPGDIIQFKDKATAIVGQNCIFLLKLSYGEDWMLAADGGSLDEFKEGDYKIIAKSSEWKIT